MLEITCIFCVQKRNYRTITELFSEININKMTISTRKMYIT